MSANKAWRKYKSEGGTLSFKEYISREKAKGFLNFAGTANVLTNKPLSDSIHQTLNKIHQQDGLQTELENKYIFGINKNALLITGVVIVGVVAFAIYKNKSK